MNTLIEFLEGLCVMCVVLTFSSCKDKNQQDIIGTWKFTISNSESTDYNSMNYEVSSSGITTYSNDGIVLDKGDATINVTITDEESYLDGVTVALKYHISCSGIYSVTNSVLTESTKDVNISFKSAKTNLPAEYQDIERELIKLYRNKLEENNFKVFKDNMYGTTTSEIVTVNDSKMVLKSIDADGGSDVTEYTRLYQAR